MKPSISLIVLTYNEEINLRKCLLSAKDLVSEIIIVDSGSTDKTKDIAKEFGAKFVVHEFKNQADQFNWTLEHAHPSGDWIMRLDADEFLTAELNREILEILPNLSNDVSGIYMKRRVYFMGRWIKHGGYYPTWFLRIFRRGKGKSEDREMDEHIVLLKGKSVELKNDFVDENKKDLSSWIAKQNKHSSREVSAVLTENKEAKEISPSLWKGQTERKRWCKEKVFVNTPLFMRSFLYFIYRYFFRLGFLDGKEGLIFHFLQGFWYRFLVDAKIYEKQKEV